MNAAYLNRLRAARLPRIRRHETHALVDRWRGRWWAPPGPRGGGRSATPTRPPATARRRSNAARCIAAVSSSGTVNPVSQVSVGSQVSGQIKEMRADFNTEVQAGPADRAHRPGELRIQGAPGQCRPGVGARRGAQRAGQRGGGDGRRVARRRLEADNAQRDAQRKQDLLAQALHLAGRATTTRATPASSLAESLKVAQAQARRGARPGRQRAGGGQAARRRAGAGQGRPGAHRDPLAGGRRGHQAQRRRRPDGGGQPAGAGAVHHRAQPAGHAGRGLDRRGRHRARQAAAGGRASRSTPSPAAASKAGSARSARRRCRRRTSSPTPSWSRFANPGGTAAAGHDGQCAHRHRDARERAEGAQRGAARAHRRRRAGGGAGLRRPMRVAAADAAPPGVAAAANAQESAPRAPASAAAGGGPLARVAQPARRRTAAHAGAAREGRRGDRAGAAALRRTARPARRRTRQGARTHRRRHPGARRPSCSTPEQKARYQQIVAELGQPPACRAAASTCSTPRASRRPTTCAWASPTAWPPS